MKLFLPCRPLCGLFAVLLLVCAGRAAPPPISPDEQLEINQAVERGVSYLKKTQLPTGTWAITEKHAVGYAALAGLALLESGVPAKDRTVQRAASFVRRMAPPNRETYELALSILFLDRLGNPRDEQLIQTLALRLVAGQGTSWGWTYRCPILPANFQRDILTVLRRLDPPENLEEIKGGKPAMPAIARKPGDPPDKGPARPREGPEAVPARPRDHPPLENTATTRPTSDKPESAAPPPEEPRPPEPAENRKPAAQRPANPAALKGPAAARPQAPAAAGPVVIPAHLKGMPIFEDLVAPTKRNTRVTAMRAVSDNSNTQFALLGLWVAQRHGVPTKRSLRLLAERFQNTQHEDGTWTYAISGRPDPSGPYAMTCVGLLALAVGQGLAADDNPAGAPAPLDPRIAQGFTALGQFLEPDERHGLYFLWSVERVAVLYGLLSIGERDWYRHGVKQLLPIQQPDGSWATQGLPGLRYPGSTPAVDTCLALLFLKRANFLEELTKKLKIDREALTKFLTDKKPASKPASRPDKPSRSSPGFRGER
jgi:hypothetical protein